MNQTETKRVADVVFIACFLLFLVSVSLFTVCKDKSSGYSYFENRMLAEEPEFSEQNLLSGTYMTETETYLKEYVVGRNSWLTAETVINSEILHRPVVNDIVVTESVLLPFFSRDYDSAVSVSARAKTVSENLAAHSLQVSAYGGSFCYVAVPCQSYCYEDAYPWYVNDRSAFIGQATSAFFEALEEKGVDYVDIKTVAEAFSESSDASFISAVDHHYGIDGAYATFAEVVNHLNQSGKISIGLMAKSEFDRVELPNRYLGSRLRKLLGIWENDEKLSVLYPTQSIPFTRTDNGQTAESTVYSIPNPEEDASYSIYMSGDVACTLIDTNRPDKPTALIYGDSFTNAVECIAWTSFDRMYSFDFRHYTEKTLSELIDEIQPDVVICIRDYGSLLTAECNGQ